MVDGSLAMSYGNQHEFFSMGQALNPTKRTASYYHKCHATIAPVNTLCLEVQYYSIQCPPLSKFSSQAHCTEPPSIIKAIQQGQSFLVSSSRAAKVGGSFINRLLPSSYDKQPNDKQPRAIAIAGIVLGVSRTSLTNDI